jgi:U3 small nucleolar RNA-associated protein 25
MESTSKDDPFLSHFETLIDETQINTKSSKTTIELSSLSLGSCQFSSNSSDKRPVLPCPVSSIDSFAIKKSLLSNIESSGSQLTPLQFDFFSLIHNYYDVYYPDRTNTNDAGEQLRFVICLHLINHVLKTRSRILSHNAKLKDNPDLDYHDQGFTRPKVLIIVPFRESVRRIINCFENLLLTIDDTEKTDQIQISHRKRFKEEYGGGEIDTQQNDGKFQRTSNEYNEIFTGNIDDHFRLGISITRKSLKFFQSVYKSDFLIVSPVGLRTLLEKRRRKRKRNQSSDNSESDDDEEEKSSNHADFLSSIECVYIDQLDILSMQNLDHLLYIFENLNCIPQQAKSSTDFSRIRHWSLNGWARFYRQLIILSSFTSPLFLSLFHRFSSNYSGRCLFQPNFPLNGYIRPLSTFHQLFQRIPVCDPTLRFNYFIEHILPRFDTSTYDHTLIYLSSYFDFVRLRNYMRTEKHKQFNYITLSEYSSKKQILLARNIFYHRQVRFLLMTERFHFYHRYRIKGIRHILFYDLPSYGHFYPEIVHFLTLPHVADKRKTTTTTTTTQTDEPSTCTALYAKEDALKLAYILGQNAVTDLLNSEKNTHLFTNK